MKRLSLAAALLVSLLLVACGGGPPEGAKTVKIEAKGPSGTGKIMGSVRASNPGTAGMSNKSFEFDIPGSTEFKAGTSEYTIECMGGLPKGVTLEISIDGRVLKPGQDMVYEPEKGPRITLDIDLAKK